MNFMSPENSSKKYKIAEVWIELDENDKITYGIESLGLHSAQGGLVFAFANLCSTSNLEGLVEIYKNHVNNSLPNLIAAIKKRTK